MTPNELKLMDRLIDEAEATRTLSYQMWAAACELLNRNWTTEWISAGLKVSHGPVSNELGSCRGDDNQVHRISTFQCSPKCHQQKAAVIALPPPKAEP
jgi:hypothetical protein